MTTWLVLDMSYLAYRAHYTTGKLSHEGNPTGVIFGIMRDLVSFAEIHATDKFVFCFDHGTNLRLEINENYKSARREKKRTQDELNDMKIVRGQLLDMKSGLLEAMMYQNIFFQNGYEADDVIASVVKEISFLPGNNEVVLISGDRDLFQLINRKVCFWNPAKKQPMTYRSFKEEFAIEPLE